MKLASLRMSGRQGPVELQLTAKGSHNTNSFHKRITDKFNQVLRWKIIHDKMVLPHLDTMFHSTPQPPRLSHPSCLLALYHFIRVYKTLGQDLPWSWRPSRPVPVQPGYAHAGVHGRWIVLRGWVSITSKTSVKLTCLCALLESSLSEQHIRPSISGVARGLLPFSAAFRQEAGYRLDKSPARGG